MKREIDAGKLEEFILKKFHSTKGHGVDVTMILQMEGRPVEVEYNHSINGVYQSKCIIKLTKEEIERCYN
jgi:hypothetical protein